MKIAFVVYPDFTALDLVGPYEVIQPLARRRGPFRIQRDGPGPVRQRPDGTPDAYAVDAARPRSDRGPG
jgi:hypothetical protein